jgi:hypothetical protein
MKKSIMYDLAYKETDVSPVTSHALEPTPLSEIFLLRIQDYSWPCSKLRDIWYNPLNKTAVWDRHLNKAKNLGQVK